MPIQARSALGQQLKPGVSGRPWRAPTSHRPWGGRATAPVRGRPGTAARGALPVGGGRQRPGLRRGPVPRGRRLQGPFSPLSQRGHLSRGRTPVTAAGRRPQSTLRPLGSAAGGPSGGAVAPRAGDPPRCPGGHRRPQQHFSRGGWGRGERPSPPPPPPLTAGLLLPWGGRRGLTWSRKRAAALLLYLSCRDQHGS